MAVDVQTAPEFRAGHARPLFTLHSTTANWDVSPDGQRFLVITAPAGPESGVRLEAVVNWFEELRRLVPAEGK